MNNNIKELISFDFNTYAYDEAQYKTRLIGTSDCNMFIPFYSLFAHNLLLFEDKKIKVLEYSLPNYHGFIQYHRQYSQMKEHLKIGSKPKAYQYKYRGLHNYINMHRGLLYVEKTIYICLGIKSDYILNTPIEDIKSNPDVTKFTLFINNEFDNVVELKNIRKKVQQMFIDPLKEVGIDIVYTSRVNNWLFKNNYKQPRFKDVMQMMKHLKEEVPKTLLI